MNQLPSPNPEDNQQFDAVSDPLKSLHFNSPIALRGLALLNRCKKAAFKSHWLTVEHHLYALELLYANSPKTLQEVLNYCADGKAPLVTVLAVKGCPAPTLDIAFRMGVNPELKTVGRIGKQVIPDCTGLHLALCNEHYETARSFLAVGATVEPHTYYGDTPVSLWISHHKNRKNFVARAPAIVQMFSDFNASFNSRNRTGETVLGTLIENGALAAANTVSLRHAQIGTHPHSKPELELYSTQVVCNRKSRAATNEQLLAKLDSLFMSAREQDGMHIRQKCQRAVETLLWSYLTNSSLVDWSAIKTLFEHFEQKKNLFPSETIQAALNSVDQKPGFERGVLHVLCDYFCSTDILEMALNLGADPNKAVAYGIELIDPIVIQTPLHIAAANSQLGHVDILLKAGARPSEVFGSDRIAIEDFTITNENALEAMLAILRASPELKNLFEGPAEVHNLLLKSLSLLHPVSVRPYSNDLRTYLGANFGNTKLLQEQQTKLFVSVAKMLDLPNGSGAHFESELLLQCCKLTRIPLAAFLVENGITLPSIFLGGKPADHHSEESLAKYRQTLLDDLNYLVSHVKFAGKGSSTNSSTALALLDNLSLALVDRASNTSLYFDFEDIASAAITEESYDVTHRRPLMNGLLSEHVAQILSIDGNVHDAADFIRARRAITSNATPDFVGSPLARLLPKLLHRYPVTLLSQHMHEIEYNPRGKMIPIQANLVEYFALLTHRDFSAIGGGSMLTNLSAQEAEETLGIFTSSISSTTSFIKYASIVNGTAISIWRDVANEGLGFRRYKYDTRASYGVDNDGKKIKLAPSLFEAAGGMKIEEVFRNSLQGGFAFFGADVNPNNSTTTTTPARFEDSLHSQTLILARRGAYIISNAKAGIFVIRNSSLVFGRDLLRQPAYFLPKSQVPPFSNDDIESQYSFVQSLTAEFIEEHFLGILDPILYEKYTYRRFRRNEPSIPSRLLEIQFLQNELKKFRLARNSFFFDTNVNTAWQKDENGADILVGGPNSRGFPTLVTLLTTQLHDAKDHATLYGEIVTPPLQLELYNPNFLPFAPYARLIVDEEVLTLLEHFAVNGWHPNSPPQPEEELDEDSEAELPEAEVDHDVYERTGIAEFFQKALSNQSELVIVETLE